MTKEIRNQLDGLCALLLLLVVVGLCGSICYSSSGAFAAQFMLWATSSEYFNPYRAGAMLILAVPSACACAVFSMLGVAVAIDWVRNWVRAAKGLEHTAAFDENTTPPAS